MTNKKLLFLVISSLLISLTSREQITKDSLNRNYQAVIIKADILFPTLTIIKPFIQGENFNEKILMLKTEYYTKKHSSFQLTLAYGWLNVYNDTKINDILIIPEYRYYFKINNYKGPFLSTGVFGYYNSYEETIIESLPAEVHHYIRKDSYTGLIEGVGYQFRKNNLTFDFIFYSILYKNIYKKNNFPINNRITSDFGLTILPSISIGFCVH